MKIDILSCIIGFSIYGLIDLCFTIWFIRKGRKLTGFRHGAINSLRVLLGDAYLRVFPEYPSKPEFKVIPVPRYTTIHTTIHHMCAVCGENPVDVENGFDTCHECTREGA